MGEFWGNAGGGLLGGIFNLIGGAADFSHQRALQSDQNDWQSAENKANREFQAEEALKAREWQEDFYQQYQSPEAQLASQMAGFKAQGINPALMFGKSAPTGGPVPSTSVPSGSANGAPAMHANSMGIAFSEVAQGINTAEQLMMQQDKIKQMELMNKFIKQQEMTLLSEEIYNYLNGDILRINYEDLSSTQQERVAAMIAEHKSTQLDYKIYDENKEYFAKAISLQNDLIGSQTSYYDAQASTQKKLEELYGKQGELSIKQGEYLESLKAINGLAQQMQQYEVDIQNQTKDATIRKVLAEIKFENFLAEFQHQYMAKTGINPLSMNDFQVMLVDTLRPFMKGQGNQEDWDALIDTINPHSSPNVWLDVMDGLFGITEAMIGGYVFSRGSGKTKAVGSAKDIGKIPYSSSTLDIDPISGSQLVEPLKGVGFPYRPNFHYK